MQAQATSENQSDLLLGGRNFLVLQRSWPRIDHLTPKVEDSGALAQHLRQIRRQIS